MPIANSGCGDGTTSAERRGLPHLHPHLVAPPQSAREFFLQSFLMTPPSSGNQKKRTDSQYDRYAILPATSENEDNNNGKRKQKPIFVLHVGLPKTGTTFLQCFLCSNPNVTVPVLAKDNFAYVGTCPYTDCRLQEPQSDDDGGLEPFLQHSYEDVFLRPRAVEEDSKYAVGIGPVPHTREMAYKPANNEKENYHDPSSHVKVPQLHPNFLRHLENSFDRNALMIFEGCSMLSAKHIRALAAVLNPNWNVHVVVQYRPLYSWLPSKYMSVLKPSRQPPFRIWPGQYDAKTNTTGTTIPPFDLDDRGVFSQYVRNHLQLRQQSSRGDANHGQQQQGEEDGGPQHPAETVRNNFALHFENVHVLPYVEQRREREGAAAAVDPLLDFFFCTVLKYVSPTTCELLVRQRRQQNSGAAKQQKKIPDDTEVASRNRQFPINYDLLAVEAYLQGLFNTDDDDDEKNTNRKRQFLSREKVTYLVAQQQEDVFKRTPTQFQYRTCLPNSTLERLERISLALEQRLFPPGSSSAVVFKVASQGDGDTTINDVALDDEQVHHDGFVRAHEKQYCTVDAAKTLQMDSQWRDFFASLDKREDEDGDGASDDGSVDNDDGTETGDEDPNDDEEGADEDQSEHELEEGDFVDDEEEGAEALA